MNINPKKPLLELTVEEFLELQELNALEKKYEYGLIGLAKVLGCSRSHITRCVGRRVTCASMRWDRAWSPRARPICSTKCRRAALEISTFESTR